MLTSMLLPGPKLAGENLTGRNPAGEAAIRHRAYLSNVSVARLARRQVSVTVTGDT